MKTYFIASVLILILGIACSSSPKAESETSTATTQIGAPPAASVKPQEAVTKGSKSEEPKVKEPKAKESNKETITADSAKKEDCAFGFKKENDKCTRICPKGKVYSGGICKTCEETVGKTLWLTEEFLDVYTETPMERNVCGNDDGCTLSEKEVKAKDGEVTCVPKKRDESFCNSLAKKIKDKASWAGADILKDFKVGRCDGAKLVEIATEYRKNFDGEIKYAVEKCRSEKTYEVAVFVPPSMDINKVMTKNCYPLKRDAESGKEFRDELKELFMDVRSIPVYTGLID